MWHELAVAPPGPPAAARERDQVPPDVAYGKYEHTSVKVVLWV
jgi:hypothetical protein